MAFVFNQDAVKSNARKNGFSSQQAAILNHLALDRLRHLHMQTGEPVTLECIAEAIKQYATEEVERERAIKAEVREQGVSIVDDMEEELRNFNKANDPDIIMEAVNEKMDGMRSKRFKFDDDGLEHYFGREDPYNLPDGMATLSLKHYNRDIITAMCQHTELAVELGKHLRPEDIVTLYSTSQVFHHALNGHLLSSIRMWISHRAPEAGQIFKFKLYRRYLVPDPAGRTWQEQYEGTRVARQNPQLMREIRTVPGLRYLQLVLGRDRCCRQIIAIMARNGFLMPKTMLNTLLRLWLLMDIPTSGQRQALMRNQELWTDNDLYNAQLFFMKLSMHFNDPIYGPSTNEVLHLMMGQKGLYPLWQLLLRKRFTTLPDILELQVRYDFELPADMWGDQEEGKTLHGVPISEVGIGHFEGWGLGDRHLLRPDELIPLEAVARGLELDKHLMYMMMWGYIDFETGENVVPSEEDIYISDEEAVLAHMDCSHHWRKKHALKKRFDTLSPEEQQEIIAEDEDDRLRALAWCGDIDDYDSDSGDGDCDETYALDDEIRRGYIVRPQAEVRPRVPEAGDKEGWRNFVNSALRSVAPELDEEQRLRAQAWFSYQTDEMEGEWDWQRWLQQEGHSGRNNSAASQDTSDHESESVSSSTNTDETIVLPQYETYDADDDAEDDDYNEQQYEWHDSDTEPDEEEFYSDEENDPPVPESFQEAHYAMPDVQPDMTPVETGAAWGGGVSSS